MDTIMTVSIVLLHALLCGVRAMSNSTDIPKKDLYLLGLFPFSGPWHGGLVALTAAHLALEHINVREDILPGYQLRLTWEDTQCNAGRGTQAMYEQLYRDPVKIMILGAACSPVSEATARASHFWNITQLSYASVSPALSKKSIFPRFLRVSAPDLVVNPARIDMFRLFGWKRIATINEPLELFTIVLDDMVDKLKDDNISIVTSEIFKDDPTTQVQNLKKHDARIIIGGFYQDKAYKVFCEAYKVGLYGPRIVWILVGWWDADWYTQENDQTDCTVEEITIAAEGIIRTFTFLYNPMNDVGISGLDPAQYQELFRKTKARNDTLFAEQFAGQFYDAAWAAALGLNHTQTELRENGSALSLEDFKYDEELGNRIHSNMWNVNFVGNRGRYRFDENGDSFALVKIDRVEGGVVRVLGMHDPEVNNGSKITWFENNGPTWAYDHPPADSTITLYHTLQINTALYSAVAACCAIGVAIGIGFMAFNVIYRNERIIKMSSPRINSFILMGCIMTYVSVVLETSSKSTMLPMCKARDFMFTTGFSMAFGGLFSKTWRVYYIFTNAKMKRRVVRDWHLYMFILTYLCINLFILILREILDCQSIETLNVDTEERNDGDLVVQYQVNQCTSSYKIYFLGVMYGIQGIFLLFGAFLAWETRKVKIEALNDSQYIGVCIYNIFILSILGVIISFTLTENIDLHFGVLSVFIIFGTTLTQCILFLPKIMQYKEVRVNPGIADTTFATATNFTITSKSTLSALEQMKDLLKKRDMEIAELKMRLEQTDDVMRTNDGTLDVNEETC